MSAVHGGLFTAFNPAVSTGSFDLSQLASVSGEFSAAANCKYQVCGGQSTGELNDNSLSVLWSDGTNQSAARSPSRSPSLFSPDRSLTRAWSHGKSLSLVQAETGLSHTPGFSDVTPGQFRPSHFSTPGVGSRLR